jgi:hypothetical protein
VDRGSISSWGKKRATYAVVDKMRPEFEIHPQIMLFLTLQATYDNLRDQMTDYL